MSRFTIRAFVGPNGGGKTLGAIETVVIPAWRRGRPVWSNLALNPAGADCDPALFRPLVSWRQIPELAGCVLLLDEISSVLPSRQASTVPPQLIRVLNQLRKIDVECVWTAPAYARCDVLLREVTQAVTVCTGSFPDRWQRVPDQRRLQRAHRDGAGRRVLVDEGWQPNRLFSWQTYEAQAYDEFNILSAQKRLKPVQRRWYWRPSGLAQFCYGTLDQVGLLDHLDDVGACIACGGHRARPKCTCPRPDVGPAEAAVGGAAAPNGRRPAQVGR